MAQKTIHHRNKSSPALSSMAQAGALRAVAKRTAFGDLSNTANTLRSTRDDSTIGSKISSKAKENVPLLQDKKHPAFQKPAQRPMPVSNLRTTLNNSTNIHPAVRQPLAESKQSIPRTANIHVPRVTTKKSTTVFRDAPPAASRPACEDNEGAEPKQPQQIDVPVPPVHRELPQLPTAPTSSQGIEPRNERPEVFSDALESQDEIHAPATSDTIDEENMPCSSVELVKICKDTQAAITDAPNMLEVHEDSMKAAKVPYVPKTNHYVSKVPLADHASRSVLNTLNHPEPLKRQRLAPVSEPEEHWIEEAVESLDEDGYVTARSFKSRGDSTTGVGTTVLFPHHTQNSRREIALATELVEGCKTVEELEDEAWDTTMVAEYGEEIFEYMKTLEVFHTPCLTNVAC